MSPRTRIRIAVSRSGWFLIAALIAIGIRDLGIANGIAGALMVVVSLAMHELAHVAAALACDVPVYEVGMKGLGAYNRRQPATRRRHEVVIAAAGPFANVLLFFGLFFVPKIGPWLSAWNLGILVLNLAPYPGTDGFRILKTIFGQRTVRADAFLMDAKVQQTTS